MHTYILHITGFILKHGSSCIRNYNRNVRLTYSFHTSCSDLDMVKCTLCNEEFETDELLKKTYEDMHLLHRSKKYRKMTLTDKEKILQEEVFKSD